MTLGAYLGILVDAKFFKGSHRTLNETTVIRSIFRFAFSAVLFFPNLAWSWAEFSVASNQVLETFS